MGISIVGTAGGPLASGQVALASTDTTVYTVPVGSVKLAEVDTFVLTNVTSSAVTVSVSVVPPGGAVDGTHKVVSAYPLAANDSTKITELEGALLSPGTFISINASAVTAVDYLITGITAS